MSDRGSFQNYLFRLILIIAIVIYPYSFGNAADWYVDNNASGANNGTSWTDAWSSFNRINWGAGGVKAGDTLFISGGSVSKTYNEGLSIGASGTDGSPIRIRVGQDPGHNGVATITNASGIGIEAFSKHHIILDGNYNNAQHIRVTGSNRDGIYFYNVYESIITYVESDRNARGGGSGINGAQLPSYNGPVLEISYSKVHDNYEDGVSAGVGARGHDTPGYGRIKIHHNEIYNIADDGISTGIWGVDIYENVMHDRFIGNNTGHPDGMQCLAGYLRIYNNIMYNFQHPTDVTNSYIQPGFFDNTFTSDCCVRVYNNLLYLDEPKTDPFLRGIEWSISGVLNTISDVVIANNTIVGMPLFGIFASAQSKSSGSKTNTSDIYIVNNIFVDSGTTPMQIGRGGEQHTYGSWGESADVIVDHNIVDTRDMRFKGKTYTYSDYKAVSGCEDNGYNADPSLDSNYRADDPSDTPVDLGVDVSSLLTGHPLSSADLDGNPRPQGLGWDIGSFESTFMKGLAKPNPPSNLRLLNN